MPDDTATADDQDTRLQEWTDVPPRAARSGPPHVLLVDDDVDFLSQMAEALQLEGINVETARTPGEALVQAVRNPPDVILLDILLDGADGIDVLEALRAEPETRAVPVLACTALGSRESAKLLPTLGFDGLLAKPLNPTDLARALRAHVTRTEEQ
jgi:DNA-binding response OmpR family regulator